MDVKLKLAVVRAHLANARDYFDTHRRSASEGISRAEPNSYADAYNRGARFAYERAVNELARLYTLFGEEPSE